MLELPVVIATREGPIVEFIHQLAKEGLRTMVHELPHCCIMKMKEMNMCSVRGGVGSGVTRSRGSFWELEVFIIWLYGNVCSASITLLIND